MAANTTLKPNLSNTSLEVLKRRYLLKDDDGKNIEKPDDLFKRVANHVAEAEKSYSGLGEKEMATKIYNILVSFDLLPNSRTLINAG